MTIINQTTKENATVNIKELAITAIFTALVFVFTAFVNIRLPIYICIN